MDQETKFYFAPLEGITGYVYRSVHHEFYPGLDKYFTPFLSPNQNRALNPKEIRDISPEHNRGIYVVPQILTNRAEYFIRACRELKDHYGYEEVNLNLGCPSGTVVSKGKGAGFLAKTKELDEFLQEIYAKTDINISVKTRIGVKEPEEFYELLEIFNQYPIHELVIHPRVQKDYYKNTPDRKIYKEAVRRSSNALCYNGDIFSPADYEGFQKEFPETDKLMLGRGLLMNPALAEVLKEKDGRGKTKELQWQEANKKRLKEFHDTLYNRYRETLSGDTPVLYKMKEIWLYMIRSFPDHEKYLKKIKKASRLCDYEEVIRQLFAETEALNSADLKS